MEDVDFQVAQEPREANRNSQVMRGLEGHPNHANVRGNIPMELFRALFGTNQIKAKLATIQIA